MAGSDFSLRRRDPRHQPEALDGQLDFGLKLAGADGLLQLPELFLGDQHLGRRRNVSGQDDHFHVRRDGPLQLQRQVETILPVGQVVVRNQQFGRNASLSRRQQRRVQIRRRRDRVAVLLQHDLEQLAQVRVILGQQYVRRQRRSAFRRDRIGRRQTVTCMAVGSRGEGHLDGEHRSVSRRRAGIDPVAEHVGEALDNRQPEPHAFGRRPSPAVDLVILAEDVRQLLVVDADPGIPDLDAKAALAAPAADQHAAGVGIAYGIAQQVADHLQQQAAVRLDDRAGRHQPQLERLRLRVIQIFRVQTGEDLRNRKIFQLIGDHAGFDLVDVQHRVQHAGHCAHRLLDPVHQVLGLGLDGAARQQPVDEGERLQRLAQVMAGGRQEARLRDARMLRLPDRRLQRLHRFVLLQHIDIGDDDAFDRFAMAAIGQDAAQEPGAFRRRDFPLDNLGGFQHGLGFHHQLRVDRERAQVCQRPPDVRRDHAKHRLRRRREKPDAQLPVEEQRRHIRAVENVLQVVRCRALALQRFLQLAVENRQLLVQRLQLLLRGHQLFVRGLIFLVQPQRVAPDLALGFQRPLKQPRRMVQFLAQPRHFNEPQRVAALFALARLRRNRQFQAGLERDQHKLIAVIRHKPDIGAERRRAARFRGFQAGNLNQRLIRPCTDDGITQGRAVRERHHRQDFQRC